jgi:topoisomerase IV subunit B
MAPETRRLVRLTVTPDDTTEQLLDQLLAKRRAADRRRWLEEKGNLAEV